MNAEKREELIQEHEEALIRVFIKKERRERYRTQLNLIKKRPAFLDRLSHRFPDDIDARSQQNPVLLADVNAEWTGQVTSDHPCVVLALEDRFDRRVIVVDALRSQLVDASFGILVSVIPGNLVFYSDELACEVIVLRNRARN